MGPDRWRKYKKTDPPRVEAPKSILDAIEIKSIAEDGIFEIGKGGTFSKTYSFSDVNYSTASIEEKIAMGESWARWLNSNNQRFKMSFNNRNRDMRKFREDILFAHRMDVYDDLRDSFNEIIEDKILDGRQGIEQELYITITCDTIKTYEDAKGYFNNLEISMNNSFSEIGSTLRALNAKERLEILHNVYRFGKEDTFNFDFTDFYKKGWDFKEAICSSKLDFTHDTYFVSDDSVYGSAIYIKNYPGKLSNRFLTKLFSLNVKMLSSIDSNPISMDDVNKRLDSLYMDVQSSISKQNRKRRKEKNFDSEISYKVQKKQDYIKSLIDDVNDRDQRVFWSSCIFIILADSLDKLNKDIDTIVRTAKSDSVILDYCYGQQREALNTVLPIGVKQVNIGRPLLTKSLSAFFPLNVQELMVSGGIYYGANKVSKNLVMGNRKKLLNGNGFIFGVTGSGKTTVSKLEMLQTFLKSDDDVIVIDPKGDYGVIGEKCNGTEIFISTTSPNYVNPLEYYCLDEGVNVADEKTEIVLALVEACKKEPLDAQERAIISRCLKYVYKDDLLNVNSGKSEKTLQDLYREIELLTKDPGSNEIVVRTAENLLLYLEPFVFGSLNMFSKKTNVDVNNRFIIFNLSNLGKTMWDIGILVMLEHITERIKKNYKENRATRIYIDELHVLLANQNAQEYLLSLWKKVRFMGGLCTGITQNVGDLLKNDTTIALVENSEFIVILKQNHVAFDKILETIGITPEQVKYITTESGSGRGLLKCGQTIVPIDLFLDKESDIYEIIDTNALEKFEKNRKLQEQEYE